MTLSITHSTIVTVPDDGTSPVGTDEWNDPHTITGLGTGVEAALAVNVGSAGAPVLFNGAGGTPSAITLTNGTGLPLAGLSGSGTGVTTALGVNVGSAGAFVVNGGALGTPASGVATNLTGTASGLTAGNVTTNANLTGVITSVGNATSIASQTGTGTKFVVDTSPTLVTPALGVATGTSLALNGATLGTNALALIGTIECKTTTDSTAAFVARQNSTAIYFSLDSTNRNMYMGQSSGSVFTFSVPGNSQVMGSGTTLGWCSAGNSNLNTADTILTRGGAAATIQHGAANAASPVAQTVQAQGSRAGTDSNVGGANFTIQPGAGTGTGSLSSLILKSPIAVASGSGAQTQTTSLTVKGGMAVVASYTVATLPTGIQGGYVEVTDGDASLAWGATVTNSGAGATPYLVWYNGTNWTVVGK